MLCCFTGEAVHEIMYPLRNVMAVHQIAVAILYIIYRYTIYSFSSCRLKPIQDSRNQLEGGMNRDNANKHKRNQIKIEKNQRQCQFKQIQADSGQLATREFSFYIHVARDSTAALKLKAAFPGSVLARGTWRTSQSLEPVKNWAGLQWNMKYMMVIFQSGL